MNVAICTATAGSPKATYTTSLIGALLYYMSVPVSGHESEERGLTYDLLIGSVIITAREQLVEQALAGDATHLLFIDDDMGFKSDCLNIALSRNAPIVIANYRRKTPPWTFTARRGKDEIITRPVSPELEEASFGGFGFALIRRDVLEATKRPRFLNQYVEDYGTEKWQYTTEDFAFYEAARAAGFKVLVDHEISRRVWHVGEFAYDHSQIPLAQRRMASEPNEPVDAMQSLEELKR
jgi:hypothetical protein